MHDHSRYILVCDNCDNCSYITNAFTLLKLPLKTLTIQNIIESPEDLSNAKAIILCTQLESHNRKRIHEMVDLNKTMIISCIPPLTKHHDANVPVRYLKLPFSESELKDILASCSDTIEDDNFTDIAINHPSCFDKLIGQSERIRNIRRMINQVARSDTTVLILGQSGTGKEVIASCIHYLSERNDKILAPINCGAIPSELMESELFGHEKGAFTGALTRRPGRFEIANGGTIFLDEIGDMPLQMQVKLLRVIQERVIDRVGGSASIKVDIRLIAATNQNLEDMIKKDLFREDLYYRLNVFPIHVPSLSERSDDIPALIDYHLDKIDERLKHRVIFTDRAKEILCNYSWPGNIRELENFLERMVILHRDCVLDEKDIEPTYKKNKPPFVDYQPNFSHDKPFNIKDYIANVERQIIQFALEQSNGIVRHAADYLSLGKSTLLEKIKKYNLRHQEE
jgi:sigma-54 dependent transcriptional regulator, flagellar regulatory protein